MIPEGEIGKYRIKHKNGYPALYKGKFEWTVDSPGTNATQQFAVDACFGRVLIGGLGTGWIVEKLAEKPEVKKITVVEIAREVIDLVWPHLDTKGKGEIVCADIFEYLRIPRDVDTIYIDIFNNAGPQKGNEFVRPLRKIINWLPPDRIFFWEEQLCIS